MDLKQIKSNYKKENKNNFEIAQNMLYIAIPDLKEKFKLCENAVNRNDLLREEKVNNISALYEEKINICENILKNILEVRNATLKDLKDYTEDFSCISNNFIQLNDVIQKFRKNMLENDKLNNGVQIFEAEVSLELMEKDINIVIKRLEK